MGEHDTNSTTDCEGDICADPVQTFEPVEIIVPTEYNEPKMKHDIALIKLDKPVNYTSEYMYAAGILINTNL